MPDQSHRRDADEIEILLVEDNPGDVRLVREAFDAAETETSIRAVRDGDNAIEDLTRRAEDESATLPDVALVDLDLPGRDGHEVLEAIRSDPRLRPLPVIVLTGSEASEDVARCYDAQANAYLTKPSGVEGFASIVAAVERFWFERAQLPPISD